MKTVLLASLMAGSAALLPLAVAVRPDPTAAPATVTVPAGTFRYREAGEFRRRRSVVDASPETRQAEAALEIMKHPVTRDEYAACVADGACRASAAPAEVTLAQVDVSYADAVAYAGWLSERTGDVWRLPTDAEWARAAAERFADGAAVATDEADPSVRWIADYGRSASLRGEADLALHPQGAFGENSLGLSDIGGNVWEWTSSCFVNGEVDGEGRVVSRSEYCGVRAVEGQHRAFVIDFVRDAKSGGCAAGLPPDYLGFRLVREAAPVWRRLLRPGA